MINILKTLLKFTRVIGTIVCFATFFIWSKLALEKLIAEPISSSISFKDGDDGRGLIKYPIVTFCPKSLSYFTQSPDFDDFCGCGNSFFQVLLGCTKDYRWANVYKDCYGKNGFTTIENSTQRLLYRIYPFLRSVTFGSNYSLPKSLLDIFGLPLNPSKLEKELLESVHQKFHQRYGTCFSFDIGEQMESLIQPNKLSLTFKPEKDVIVVLHERPEDYIGALEGTGHGFIIKPGFVYSIRFKKIQIESLSTDEHPCSSLSNYSGEYCKLKWVSFSAKNLLLLYHG